MDIWLDPIAPARTQSAFDEAGLPILVVVQFVGPFQYFGVREPELDQLMASVGQLLARFGSPLGFWRDYCEPRARQAVADLEGPLRGVPLSAVAATYGYGMALTFTSIIPIFATAMPLRLLLEQHFGPEGALLADEATQGGINASQAVDAQLVTLGALARSLPEVRRILANEDGSVRLAALRSEPTAQSFLAQFDALIAEHASRSFGWELLLPTWGEDPAAVLAMVAAHVRAEPSGGVAESSTALRDAARARVNARLTGSDRAQFDQLVHVLEGLVPIREDRAYWQMRLAGSVRLLLLERGSALVEAGRIERPDDIFHLAPDEFENGTAGLHDLVTARRAEWSRCSTLIPPPFIGAPPPLPLPVAESATRLRGFPGSRGVVTARARIVQSPDDIDRFEPGDILVCRLTTPAWTPLFSLAGGVVTETGTPLSHPAITAREYGIPCVLSVKGATTLIVDGAFVTVDGVEGTVTLVDHV